MFRALHEMFIVVIRSCFVLCSQLLVRIVPCVVFHLLSCFCCLTRVFIYMPAVKTKWNKWKCSMLVPIFALVPAICISCTISAVLYSLLDEPVAGIFSIKWSYADRKQLWANSSYIIDRLMNVLATGSQHVCDKFVLCDVAFKL